MTNEEFEKKYPREKYNYIFKGSRVKGSVGQTEIDTFEIVSKETGEVVITATRTEHTNLRGLETTVRWVE